MTKTDLIFLHRLVVTLGLVTSAKKVVKGIERKDVIDEKKE